MHLPLGQSSPLVLTVGQVPLVNQGDNASVTRSRDDSSFRFAVNNGLSGSQQLAADLLLGLLDLLAGVRANSHRALVETSLVDDLLSFVQLDAITLTVDLHASNNVLGGLIAQIRDVDNRHNFEVDLFSGQLESVAQLLLLLNVSPSNKVVRTVRRYGSDDTSSLFSADREHGPNEDLVVLGQRSLDGGTNQVLASERGQALDLAELVAVALVRQVYKDR